MRRRAILICSLLFVLATSVFAEEELNGIRTLEPDNVVKPYMSRFSHGKVVPANAQWLYTAGQTGVDLDGTVGEGIEAQADLAMRNLHNILLDAGMNNDDVIKMTIYYVEPADLPIIVAARNKYFGEDFSPASTAVGVSALARPGYLVEVELVAARVAAD